MPFDLPPVTRALLIANVAVYLLQMMTGDTLLSTSRSGRSDPRNTPTSRDSSPGSS